MFNRRIFFQKITLFWASLQLSPFSKAHAQPTGRPLVLRVHSPKASSAWDYAASFPWDHTVEPKNAADMKSGQFRDDRYYDSINQEGLNTMLDRGIQFYTGANSAKDAWMNLLTHYQQGQKITIKINLNNASYNEEVTTNRMDQSVQMINALVGSLTSALQVPQRDITIADPTRWIHPELIQKECPFTDLQWVDSRTQNRWDPAETIIFSADQPVRPPDPKFPEKGTFTIARAYTTADHIINVCLLKNHGCGITGAMKNHFGAFPSPKYLHNGLGSKSYIADVCNTPSIKNKVRINICEAIFGNWHNNVWCPRPWKTFAGETPNSLFLAQDPVALDSVLLQHIIDEVAARGTEVDQWVRDAVNDHDFLDYAMNALHLGIHEHKPFTRIDYRQIEVLF